MADIPALPLLRTTVGETTEDASPAANRCTTVKIPWVLGLCNVLFDVDKGQTLQDIWPPDCLSEEEKSAVAFHAFPDSLSMELYTRNAIRDSSFTFRIKREPDTSIDSSTPEFLYGYVFCRQRQDKTLRRGGEQVSVLVLATTPFSSALQPLSQAAGHAFFNEGPLALAMVYNQVLSWPPPVPGSSMCLPVGAGVINARLPHFCIMPPPQPAVDPAVQATLSRRISRTLSRKNSGSPRVMAAAAAAAAAAAGGRPGSSGDLSILPTADGPAAVAAGQQQGVQPAAADGGAGGSLSAEECGWVAVEGSSDQQQQQQQQQQQELTGEPGLRSRGSFSSLLGGLSGSRSNSSSRLSRLDSAAAGRAGSSSNLAAAAAAADANGSNGPCSSNSSEWLVANLGQQWRDEKPFPEVEPAFVLAPLLRDLWILWQLVVTGQPIMVVGLTPGETSAAVAALTSLIAPLTYAADFRPFFTIHDPDFIALAAGQLPKRQRYVEVLPQQQQQQQQDSAELPSPASEGSGQQFTSSNVQEGDAQAQESDTQQLQQQVDRIRAASIAKQQHLPALIGVTNLYFIKALPKWPNVVAVSRKVVATPPPSLDSRADSPARGTGSSAAGASAAAAAAGGDSSSAAASGGANSPANRPAVGSPTVPPAAARPSSGSGSGFFTATAAAAMRALQRRHQGPQHLLSHFAPHLWTCGHHSQWVKPDYPLLSNARAAIEPAVGSAGGLVSAAGISSGSSGALGPGRAAGTAALRLRRHFAELTAALLAPFEVYFTPGPSGKVPAWRPDAFLSSLEPSSLHPTLAAHLSGNTATAAAGLYGAFIESPNFAFWFQQRRAPVLHLVEDEPESESDDEAYAQVAPGGAVSSSDEGVNSEPDEVEIVQQLLSTEQALVDWQQLGREQKSSASMQQQHHTMQYNFVQGFLQVPRDLQAALFSSPARQEVLTDAAAALAAGSSTEQAAAASALQKMQELLISSSGEADAPAA